MPKKDNVGYGDCTPIKIEHLSDIVAMHLAVTRAVLIKNSNLYSPHYRYIDLTAGKGFSPDRQKGSPIAFLEQAEAEDFRLSYRADFIECETKNLIDLEDAISNEVARNGWTASDLHFHLGRYQEEIPKLLKVKKHNEFGLTFVDPSGELPDFDCLQYIAEMRPKMEILIYLSSTNVKRIYQYTGKRLMDYIADIEKSHWLIRKPIPWDQFKWTFLLGSNAHGLFKDYRRIGFYRLESQHGQKILEMLNLTEKEQIEQRQYKMF